MKIFGLEITRPKELTAVRPSAPGFFGQILEPFAGAWQRNITVESKTNLLAFSAVYSCVALISDDISKLRPQLVEQKNGIWTEVERDSPYWSVLVKPNQYQTRVQFMSYWITSKLLFGNTYILKERDSRGVVRALYCLDPRLVTPLVADNGEVFYRLNEDKLSGLRLEETFPASEIIHDRCVTLFHPLVGVSPIYACGASATQGIRIQANSETFFKNLSSPSGVLSAPGTIDDVTANRLKTEFQSKFGGNNLGSTFVAGDGLKFEKMSIPAVDAQLIEQLKWTVEDVARCFRVPLHKLGMGQPTLNNVAALNQDYYNQCLQTLIESVEILLDEGLGLDKKIDGKTYGTQLDLDGLLRMDPLGMSEQLEKLVGGGIYTPNDARLRMNKPPVAGGDAAYLQQQNYSTEALAKRDAQADPFAPAIPPAPPAAEPVPAVDEDKMVEAVLARVPAIDYERIAEMAKAAVAQPVPVDTADDFAAALIAKFEAHA